MKRYRYKAPIVEAQQWHKGDAPFEGLTNYYLNTPEPYTVNAPPVCFARVRDGNWVVTDAQGQVTLLDAEKFEQIYEPVE